MKRVIIFIVALFLFSCGTRKRAMEKSKEKITSVIQNDIETKKTILRTSNIDVEFASTKVLYKPIKKEDPMVIEGKQYKNVVIESVVEEKLDKSVVNEKEEKIVQDKTETKQKVFKEGKKVDIKRDNSIGSLYWILGLAAALIVIFVVVKRMKLI